MRIGILIKNFHQLGNWELRIIEEIIKNPNHELSLLIQDGRVETRKTIHKIIKLLTSKNIFGNLFFRVQVLIESSLFFRQESTVDRERLISYLNELPTISLKPKRKKHLDIFSKRDAEIVKKYDLDLILRHAFGVIQGEILRSARYGIWSFHHGDNDINRGGPPGFWEVMLDNPVIGVTLQKLTEELDGGLIIDKGFYNKHWSYVRNQNSIFENSVSILFKSIKRLEQGEFKPEKSRTYYNPLYKIPSLAMTLKYIVRFYGMVIKKLFQKFRSKLFGTRYDCWTLFLGKGDYLESALFRLKPCTLPKGEFWADPFLFKHQGEYYVFFENYSYKNGKGKISCGKVKDGQILDATDVLERDYHLSYPFIVKEDNEIYMIPESHMNKRLEVYKCVEFPAKWELYSTAFQGESIVDATYHEDLCGQRWLFVNKSLSSDYSSELYIYKIDSLKFEKIQGHKNNPVVIDSRFARNAGPLFIRGEKTIRPSQNNSNGVYGYGLNLSEIVKLSIDDYEEVRMVDIKPNFVKGIVSTHHLHQGDGVFVFDAAYRVR